MPWTKKTNMNTWGRIFNWPTMGLEPPRATLNSEAGRRGLISTATRRSPRHIACTEILRSLLRSSYRNTFRIAKMAFSKSTRVDLTPSKTRRRVQVISLTPDHTAKSK